LVLILTLAIIVGYIAGITTKEKELTYPFVGINTIKQSNLSDINEIAKLLYTMPIVEGRGNLETVYYDKKKAIIILKIKNFL